MQKYITRLSVWLSAIYFVSMRAIADTTNTNNSNSVSGGISNQPGVDIRIQDLFNIVAGLACWATRFVMIIMIMVIVWYGLQMMIAQGDSAKFTGARKSLTYAVIGMVVILGAYTIIATVANSVEAVGQQGNQLGYKNSKYTLFVPLSCSGY